MLINEYIVLFCAVIITTVAIYLPISLYFRKKGIGFLRQSSYLCLFFSLFFVIFCTLILFQLPLHFHPARYILNVQPCQWLWEDNIWQRLTTEIRPNIMIFIPLGFFIPCVFKQLRKWYITALAAFTVTFSIEFFQYFIGRSADVDDLIANLLGGIIGFGLFHVVNRLGKHSPQWQRFIGE